MFNLHSLIMTVCRGSVSTASALPTYLARWQGPWESQSDLLMPSEPAPWEIYKQYAYPSFSQFLVSLTHRRALGPLKYGDALWSMVSALQSLRAQSDIDRREPCPTYHSYRRVRPGDVGYINEGRFHLLFSAGIPLGSRVLGTNVPSTFEPLDVGPIVPGEVRSPGYLRTNTIREIGVDVGGSVAVAWYTRAYFYLTSDHRLTEQSSPVEPGARIAFALTHRQGAVLITQRPTYREDIEKRGNFAKYIRQHYDSWVDFARERGYGEKIKPILVTGVHLTQEFAAAAYSNSRTRMECDFSVEVPAVASGSVSLWGSWSNPGLVHTKCGPPPSRTRGSIEGPTLESEIPDDYDQCVFIRYYTIRKRFLIPTVLEAGAGPHQLPEGSSENDNASEEILLVSSEDDFTEGDYSETGSPTGASDEVIHNVPLVSLEHCSHPPLLTNRAKDGRDGFDVVAEFIFQVGASSRVSCKL